jgi:CRISPR-associated protein Csx17
MNDIDLSGCTPEPLMGYLKALGVFRLVAEQADPTAAVSWRGGVCRLHTALDQDSLTGFFLGAYRPTPVLAPWNAGSGFYGGSAEPLEAIEGSTAARLGPYREAIRAIRAVAPDERPKDEKKEALLVLCRAVLPDDVVTWLDVCFVLGEDGPNFFPLRGTGGNDGRLDFTNNFMQRLADVISFDGGPPPADSARWLESALFADTLVPLRRTAVGQFNPGGIGGANGTQGSFEADSRVNPWDFVLMVEGSMLLAGSVARRLGVNAAPRAAFPFNVKSVAVGYGSAAGSEETADGSRDELWLPLWDRPARLSELTHLFAEGRAQFGRRQAGNAVEFALAANLLGVSRGIREFARYGFLKRNGLAFLATPLGRIPVGFRPVARLLDDPGLTGWVEHFRSACRDKAKTPTRYQTALRQVDRAIYGFANRSDTGDAADRRELANVLAAIGQAERALAKGLAFCSDRSLRPVQGLSPEWLLIAADGGDEWREFRLAAALASVLAEPKSEVGPIRTHLEPVGPSRRSRLAWRPGSTSAVWTDRPLVDNLAEVFLRRFVESERAGVSGIALSHRVPAPLVDVLEFLTDTGSGNETRDARLTDLLWGLVAIRWDSPWFKNRDNRRQLREAFSPKAARPLLPWEFGMIRLVAQRVELIESEGGDLRTARTREERKNPLLATTPIAEPFHRLAQGVGSLADAIALARRRLWANQLPLARRFQQYDLHPDLDLDPRRLVAACLFPLAPAALSRLAREFVPAAGEK